MRRKATTAAPFPWGNAWNAGGRARSRPGTYRCAARTMWTRTPPGASPFGVMDMVGNVWQWTDEFIDEHTRAAHPAGRKLLSAARIDLVLSPGLSQRPSTANCC